MYLMQLIVLGLLAGAVYGLIGVGFTLVLGIGRIPNFAQGSIVGLGLYFALFMQVQFGLTPYEAFVPAWSFLRSSDSLPPSCSSGGAGRLGSSASFWSGLLSFS